MTAPRSERESNDAFEEVRCALCVFSDSLHPGEITARVGIQPTKTRPRGSASARSIPAGRTVSTNQWIWEPAQQADPVLGAQLEAIRLTLGPRAQSFRELLVEADVVLDIAIYHHGKTLRLGWTLEREQVELAAAFGAAISIDEYDY